MSNLCESSSMNSSVTELSFSFKEAWEWNRLPGELRELGSVDVLKRHLKAHMMDGL